MTRAIAYGLATAGLLALAPGPARAGAAGAVAPRFAIGLLGGTAQPDGDLADYQWEVTPRTSMGAQALVGRGRFAAGLRLRRSHTTQSMPEIGASPTVTSTSLETIARGGLANLRGTLLFATASVGRVSFAYRPERIEVPAGGAGAPVVVELATLNEWTAGAGMGFERAIADRWTASLEIGHTVFGLDTAHRDGNEIETRRERFGEWNGHFGISRWFGPR